MNFLEAIDGRDLLVMFLAGTLAGIGFYFVRSAILSRAEVALNITPGGTI